MQYLHLFQRWRVLCAVLITIFCTQGAVQGQTAKAALSGLVKDASGAVLQGARIDLEPAVQPVTSNGQGAFLLSDLDRGKYKVTIAFVGFSTYSTEVTLTAGQTAQIEAVLAVASANDEVLVIADRPRGEAAAINRTLAAENIVQVLPASHCFAAQREYSRRSGPHGFGHHRAR